VSALSAVVPSTVPLPDAAADVTLRSFKVDGRVLAFSLVITLLTSILFGLAPAVHAVKTDWIEGLKKSSRATARGGRRTRETFLIAEIALALVLLAGSGLMLKSYSRLQHADLGFRSDHLLSLEIELPTDTHYKGRSEQSTFFEQAIERIESLPDVKGVAVTSVLPLRSRDRRARFLIDNGPVLPPNERFQSDLRQVSPSYFQVMGITLKRGRLLNRYDSGARGTPLVGLVDEAFVRRFFGDADPLGHRLQLGEASFQIVGVVGDVKHVGADQEARPTLYVSYQQSPTERMNLLVRSVAAPDSLVSTVKKAIWGIDRDQPIYRVETMESVVAESTSAPRLTLSLLGCFSVVALGLAAIGIYGVMAYSVSQRTRELGVRIALGANSTDVVVQVLREGIRVLVVGLAIGLAVIVALGQLVQSMLYHTSAHDPLTLIAIATLLTGVALIACLIPARRAAKIDPMVALRCE
jgi:putative ABC transport system permease protein